MDASTSKEACVSTIVQNHELYASSEIRYVKMWRLLYGGCYLGLTGNGNVPSYSNIII